MSKQRGRLYRFFISDPPSQETKDARLLKKRRKAEQQPRGREVGGGQLVGHGMAAMVGGTVLAGAGFFVLREIAPEMSLIVGLPLYGALFCLVAGGIWWVLNWTVSRP